MSILAQAEAICGTAEKSLRELMQNAIESGEYRHLPGLAKMAELLNGLAARVSLIDSAQPSNRTFPTTRRPAPRKHRRRGSRLRGRAARISPAPSVRSSKVGYPRFLRDGDAIVKIAWSKKARAEYEHRAPKWIVDAVLKNVMTAAAKSKIFTVENLLPLPLAPDGTAIPIYQVYLALAWFRTEGLILQHGREGYATTMPSRLEESAAERWAALTPRKQTEEREP